MGMMDEGLTPGVEDDEEAETCTEVRGLAAISYQFTSLGTPSILATESDGLLGASLSSVVREAVWSETNPYGNRRSSNSLLERTGCPRRPCRNWRGPSILAQYKPAPPSPGSLTLGILEDREPCSDSAKQRLQFGHPVWTERRHHGSHASVVSGQEALQSSAALRA
jgi:hypothetical protein